MRGRAWSLLLVTFAVALVLVDGCDDLPAPSCPPTSPPEEVGRRFDPAGTGEVHGKVLWRGPLPKVPPFRSIPEPLTDQQPPPARDWPNPNVPVIDSRTAGLANAFVWLRHIDLAVARPWDLPPVHIEMQGQQFHILQGNHSGRSGFVRRGAQIDLVSRDEVFHSVQVRGLTFFTRNGRTNTFFTCTLPDKNKVLSRRLDCPEIVELSSGCGYFWMRGYLLVSAHPHVARTNEKGEFVLPGVPAGEYELAAWHPDWRVVQTERNPDNMRVQQVRFGAGIESSQIIHIEARKTIDVQLHLQVHP